MRAGDYLTSEEMHGAAEALSTGAGAALLAACRRERARVLSALAGEARIGTERIEDDIRFQLGVARGLEFAGRVRECARRELGLPADGE